MTFPTMCLARYRTEGPRICGKSLTKVGCGSSNMRGNVAKHGKIELLISVNKKLFAAFLDIHCTLFCSPM